MDVLARLVAAAAPWAARTAVQEQAAGLAGAPVVRRAGLAAVARPAGGVAPESGEVAPGSVPAWAGAAGCAPAGAGAVECAPAWAGAVGAPPGAVAAVRQAGEIVAVFGADGSGKAGFGSVLAAPGCGADLADLYASVAEGWIGAGVLTHTVTVPAGEAEAVWFDLSFGRQQAYAIADVAAMPVPDVPDGITVTEVGPEALAETAPLTELVTRHQALAPVFSRATDAWYAQLATAWPGVLADDTVRCFLARRDGVPAGFLLSEYADGLLAPPGSIELRLAAVDPAHRGSGVGAGLATAFIADARARGASHAVADWRTTNLLASRYWPRWGFRPVAYRLVRTVDLTPFG